MGKYSDLTINPKVKNVATLEDCYEFSIGLLNELLEFDKKIKKLAGNEGKGSTPYAVYKLLNVEQKITMLENYKVKIENSYKLYRLSPQGSVKSELCIDLCNALFSFNKQINRDQAHAIGTYSQATTRPGLILGNIVKCYNKDIKDKFTEGSDEYKDQWKKILDVDKITTILDVSYENLTIDKVQKLFEDSIELSKSVNEACDLNKITLLTMQTQDVVQNIRREERLALAGGNTAIVEIDKFERRYVKFIKENPIPEVSIADLVKRKVKYEKEAKGQDKKKESATKKLKAEQNKKGKKQNTKKINAYTSEIDTATRLANEKRKKINELSEYISKNNYVLSWLLKLKKDFDSKKYNGKKDPIVAKKKKDFTDKITKSIAAYKGK